jgi:hypothetical protein
MAVEEWSAGRFPADTVAAVRASLGDLVEQTITAVRGASRTYEEVLSGPAGLGIRIGIEQAIRAFLEAIERGERPPVDAAEIWRRLGEAEYQEGRSLDDLRLAFRVGTRAVWRQASTVAAGAGVSSEQVIALAEAVFIYTDELAADVVEGYLQAQSDEAGERERRRRRLVGLLMDAANQQREVIERAADLAEWILPRTLAALAFEGEIPRGMARRFGTGALTGADALGGWLLIPDPEGPGQTSSLKRGLGGTAAALGPAVGTWHANRSLKLARLTLRLVQAGVLPGGAPVRSSDHLSALIVHQDPELASELARARLAPLDTVPAADRTRLLETLDAWLRHQRRTPRIAEELHVHPQTVRYRIATLKELLGDVIDTPQGRFELELALRARQGSR